MIYDPQKGFVALMATIIIGCILLMMALNVGSVGWFTRFSLLDRESKEMSRTLAEGCLSIAQLSFVLDPNYAGSVSVTRNEGTCEILPTNSAAIAPTIQIRASVKTAHTNLESTTSLNDIHMGTPLPANYTPITNSNLTVETISLMEKPKLP